MSTQEKINDLKDRRLNIEKGGKDKGLSPARIRIDKLLDLGSFVEVGKFVKHRSTSFNMSMKEAPADGVITGYGTIGGRLVYVYSQDASVLNGSVGEMHAKKIGNVYELAMKMGAPVIGLLDSAGLRLQEATDGLGGYGDIFLKQTLASGVIPQITVILGDCAGGAAVIPNIADFTIMLDRKARLFVNSPNTMEKETDYDTIGGAAVHSELTGTVDFVESTEEACLERVQALLDFLPSNNVDEPPVNELSDDLNRQCEILQENEPMETIIAQVADDQVLLEVKKNYGMSMAVGFIRLNGSTVGVVANREQKLDREACEKAAGFIHLCDAYNIPIVSFTNVTGFKASKEEEQGGLAKAIAKLTYALAHASVPKINMIVGEAYGSAYVTMNAKHIGADIVYAWPNAKVSVMNAESAVRIMYADEIKESGSGKEVIAEKVAEFEKNQSAPYAVAARGFIDDIIEPRCTRKRIIAALEMLVSKRDTRPLKKHGTML